MDANAPHGIGKFSIAFANSAKQTAISDTERDQIQKSDWSALNSVWSAERQDHGRV